MKPLALFAALATACCLVGAAHAGKAHEHGVAKLDVAVDAQRVSVLLELPLDTLLGFEREPRSDAEKAQLEAALAKLRQPTTWVHPDPAAGCTLGRVDVVPPKFGGGAGGGGHADVEASIEFTCKDAARVGFMEVTLFDLLPRLQRVEVQAVTRRGQMQARLKKPTTRLPLAR